MSRFRLRQHGRRAAAMMMALVVLMVVGLVSGLALRAILRSHRQVREEQQRMQAELLADSALSRAMAKLRTDPAWKGETWTVSLGDANEGSADVGTSGVANIRVEKGSEEGGLLVSVTAVYPDDPVHRAQAERELTYTLPKPGERQ